MSDTISISVSAAAIFSAEEGWGRPPPNRLKDMASVSVRMARWVSVFDVMVVAAGRETGVDESDIGESLQIICLLLCEMDEHMRSSKLEDVDAQTLNYFLRRSIWLNCSEDSYLLLYSIQCCLLLECTHMVGGYCCETPRALSVMFIQGKHR